MANINSNAQKIREINAKIVDTDHYKFTDHTGKEVTKTGAELKRYLLVSRNFFEATSLEDLFDETEKEAEPSVSKQNKKEQKEKAALAPPVGESVS